jgi:hypothetical protein
MVVVQVPLVDEAIEIFNRRLDQQTFSKDTVKKRKQYFRGFTSIDEKINPPENTIEKSVIYSDNEREAARAAVIAKAVSSKKEALAFLKGAGILDKKGELAEPYR